MTNVPAETLPARDLLYRYSESVQAKPVKTPTIKDKIRDLKIKEFRTENFTLREVVQQLSLQSRTPDPDKTGIAIILKYDPKIKLPQNISMAMTETTVEAILQQACKQSGFHYEVDEFAVFVLPPK